MTLSVIPVIGIGEVHPGDDLAGLILDGFEADDIVLEHHDVVVVTHKVVSKAEGAIASYSTEEEYRRLVEGESAAVIRRRGALTISITRHGFICANAGVDRSNVEPGHAVLHPHDPDRSAHRLRVRFERATGVRIAVIVTDTFGRVWRRGLTDVAIGAAPTRGTVDSRSPRWRSWMRSPPPPIWSWARPTAFRSRSCEGSSGRTVTGARSTWCDHPAKTCSADPSRSCVSSVENVDPTHARTVTPWCGMRPRSGATRPPVSSTHATRGV
jgi:hypothetical protein